MYQHSNLNLKKTAALVVTFVQVWFFSAVAFAQSNYYCDTWDQDGGAHPGAIICLIARVLRIFIYAAGLVFVAVGAFGAWKINLAMGDPKALAGGKNTWSYAVYGLAIVLGFFALFTIITGLLGISAFGSPNAILDKLMSGIQTFLDAAQITGGGSAGP